MSERSSRDLFNEAAQFLDQQCRHEYGKNYGLLELLADPNTNLSADRLRRLTGVIVKRKFGNEVKIKSSTTGALHGWAWFEPAFEYSDLQNTDEYKILDQLRNYLKEKAGRDGSWEDFRQQVDEERGLFKVLALWTDDVLKQREKKSYKEYLDQQESRNFSAVLDIADFAANHVLGKALTPFVPAADVILPLVVIGVRYGYRTITDAPYEGDRITDPPKD